MVLSIEQQKVLWGLGKTREGQLFLDVLKSTLAEVQEQLIAGSELPYICRAQGSAIALQDIIKLIDAPK